MFVRTIVFVALVVAIVLNAGILWAVYRGRITDYWTIAFVYIAGFVVIAAKVVKDLWLDRQEYRYTVNVSATEVTCVRSDGEQELVLWGELQSVLAYGAYMEGYTLLLNGVRSGCVVPDTAKGINVLLRRLRELPGFDWNGITQAAMSEEGEYCNCWTRAAAPDN